MMALIVCGLRRTGLVQRWLDPRHIAALGVAQTNCIECDGTGVFEGHPEINFIACVACKGTGRIYVNA